MSHRPAARPVRSVTFAACCLIAAAALAAPAAAARPRPSRAHATPGARTVSKRHASEHAGRRHGRSHERRTVRHRVRDAFDEGAVAPAAAALPVLPTIPQISLSAGPSAAPVVGVSAAVPAGDTLAGRSGKLRARFVVASAAVADVAAGAARSVASYFPYLRRLLGDTANAGPAADAQRPFAFIAMRPFSEKVAGRIGGYNMGFWPGETSARGGERYRNPAGFIEVTAANQFTYVSEHFRLADFLTHDQQAVWPKYLVLHEALLDKLELVLDDLRAHGYQAERLQVMSGFRTPQYNRGGGDPSGRAELSRHQYGDAADVWVENGSGAMADLNGDGRVDARDAAVLAAAAERVEAAHPELTGGVGIYRGNGAHGPFVHIDTRGVRARWGHG